MTKRVVLVDGYNLIKNDPTLAAIEVRSLEAGRRALISRLLSTFNAQANDITVVFDGSDTPLPAPASERHGHVKVVFSRQGETADSVILRLVNAVPPGRQLVLLSDDRKLRAAVEARGGAVGGAADRKCPRLVSKQMEDDSNGQQRGSKKKGNPHRAKRRSRQTSPVRW